MNTIEALIAGLKLSPRLLSEFVGEIPPDKLEARRRRDAWTIRQHVNHLAEVQPMLFERLRRFRDEPAPDFTPFAPNPEGAESGVGQGTMREALEEFRVWRERQIELIHAFRPEVYRKLAHHPEYEIYTPGILIRHILSHDHWHMHRMEELWLVHDEYLTTL